MKKINMVLAISAGLAGWAVLASNPISFGMDANPMEEAVAAQLRDPSSASFRNVMEGSAATCGEVNGTNVFGAAAGFRQFVYIGGVVLFEPEQPALADTRRQTAYLTDLADFTRAQRRCRK